MGPSSRKKRNTQLKPMAPSPSPAALIGQSFHPDLVLPADVESFLLQVFSDCNRRISFQLSAFPNAHEEALDLQFISYFASMQGAIRFGSQWTVRIDAHYIGGGRHYRTWEVAGLGIMAIFRRGGKIEKSKLTFLQSKKLYASPLKVQEY